jgi:hypothetical protein
MRVDQFESEGDQIAFGGFFALSRFCPDWIRKSLS